MPKGLELQAVKKIEAALKQICTEHLDAEYGELSQKMLANLAEEEHVCLKLKRGKPESWAAGILTTLGRINFLSDDFVQPCMTLKELAKKCGVSPATAASKAGIITTVMENKSLAGDFEIENFQQVMEQSGIGARIKFNNTIQSIISMMEAAVDKLPPQQMEDLVKVIRGESSFASQKENETTNHISISRGGLEEDDSVIFLHSETVYQIKISLNGFKPVIWRRVQTPDMPLNMFAHLVKYAMGWVGGHLHHFEIGHEFYGDQSMLDDVEDESDIFLSDLMASGQKKASFTFLYDFGDSWEHKIVIEKQFETTEQWTNPKCIAGKNACPPEDCGGVWGYADLCEAKKDPSKSQADYEFEQEDIDDLDPEAFDLDETNHFLKILRRVSD